MGEALRMGELPPQKPTKGKSGHSRGKVGEVKNASKDKRQRSGGFKINQLDQQICQTELSSADLEKRIGQLWDQLDLEKSLANENPARRKKVWDMLGRYESAFTSDQRQFGNVDPRF